MLLAVLQIIVAALFVLVILLQMQGSGTSGVFGGGGEFYRSRRSVERLLVWVTVFLSVLFGLLSIVLLIPR